MKYTFRKLFNDIHLWLGIASGLVLFIVCLSGTIYTFHSEIEALVEPAKYHVEADAQARPIPVDALKEQLGKELKGSIVAIEIPQDRESTYRVSVAPESEGEERGHGRGADKQQASEGKAAAGAPGNKAGAQAGHGGGPGGGGRPTTYFVNPYNAEVLGTTDGPATEFFRTMMQLHRWLLIDGGVGKMIVGISTIIFVFLVLTGLVLWFPVKLKNWKQGLKIKTDANWKRVNHDLHNTLGFYSSILLLIMSITGLCWSFEWYRDGLSSLMGAEVFKGRGEKPLSTPPSTADAATLSIADYIARANAIMPEEGNIRIALPQDDTTAVVVTKTAAGFFAFSAPDKVQLNQYTGQPLKVEMFADKPLNVQLVSLIKPLHLGEVYGTFSKILYFIACLFATSLPVTGTLIWINKLRKKKPKRRVATAA
ncbi:PepSY domain-containing protein [Pontibacter diazotrophicus]|uniref:PepSY domain-containing protein n=1 Tax=Pontibacter diazotrophicus TaxID=1400979 RepID=A0A3D8LC94_9BACT|nr:PepSY-associated TM helix domain-containing protein [Pontibacter diazotrophicus]RDV14904.1 PepSY domain-containing protein [Pontibacter diazotrophicus]